MAALRILKDQYGKLLHVKAVFFDVGGTLVTSNLTHLDLLHQALTVVGYKVTRDKVAEANDLARRAVARRRRRLVAHMDPNEASRMWLDHLAEGLDLDLRGKDLEQELSFAIRRIETSSKEVVDPDAVPLLEVLKGRGLPLGIISNWSADLAAYLERCHLAKYFDVILASEAMGAAKPHREIFLRGLAALGCPPGNAVHVGDDYWADVVGARSLGIHPVLIDRTGEAIHADCIVIARLSEVEGLV